ncbi:MAG: hypothetical protein BWX80_03155 [Candidatus Hydrogenedentes bacterium ADurb.Bin101]|nr:MAG: hypothetical protein BWX80_03155 [Candidatus Hydrogenedentes bacterium ADurb.Bin101]
MERCAHKFHLRDLCDTDDNTVDPVSAIRIGSILASDVPGHMYVGGAHTGSFRNIPQPAVLRVRFDEAFGAEKATFLIHRPLETVRENPVIVEVNAHPVIKLHFDLHGVKGVHSVLYL